MVIEPFVGCAGDLGRGGEVDVAVGAVEVGEGEAGGERGGGWGREDFVEVGGGGGGHFGRWVGGEFLKD